MRLPEDRIKQGILHEEEEVRITALQYFTDSLSRDTTVMPLVIRAVETYGKRDSLGLLRSANTLVQTPDTVAWLAGQLGSDLDLSDIDDDNHRFAVALALYATDPELLLTAGTDFAESPNFPVQLASLFADRLQMHAWDWETGWAALGDFGRRISGVDTLTGADVEWANSLVESLARHVSEGAPAVLDALRGNSSMSRGEFELVEPLLVDLAGMMQLGESIPLLVERMGRDDVVLADACLTALVRIGDDEVVQAVVEDWPAAGFEFCLSAANVLENIHTDRCVQACNQLLGGEEEPEIMLALGHSLLGHFCDEGIEPVRALVEGPLEDLEPDQSELRFRLAATCAVMGASFADYEAWYDEARRNRWGWEDYQPIRLLEQFDLDRPAFGPDSADDFDAVNEEDINEEFGDESLAEEAQDDEPPAERIEPIVKGESTGRNDPCPCGSGKKYKKCCLKKPADDKPPE